MSGEPETTPSGGREGKRATPVTRITLVRHGETDWNRQRRIQGSTDIPLNDAGVAQAAVAAHALADAGYTAVYASALSRALQTAAIIADAAGLGAPVGEPELNERAFGEAEGLTNQEILGRFPDDVVPGRETREHVVRRALPVLESLAVQHAGESVLVVTHGAVIGSLIRHLTNGERPRQGELISNLSLSHLWHDGGRLRLEEFNLPATAAQAEAFAVPADSTSVSAPSSADAEPAQV